MPHQVQVFLAVLVLVATAAACGSDDRPEGADPAPSPGTGVPVRGTERLSWDQAAPSYQRLLQYTFNAYVDGTRTTLSGVDCLDSSGTAGFSCSARLPQMSNGAHVLELAAIVDSLESSRSSPLAVTVIQGRLVVDGTNAVGSESRARAASVCVAQSACFTVTREITSAAPLSSPAATPDGRLFFVEDGRHVRVLDQGVPSGPAFSLAGDSRLIAVLVDPSFDRTRFVRLAWIEQTRQGRALVVTRLRESNNRLGEPAVIVPGILLAGNGDPRVAQDDQGRIYVAIPGDTDARRSEVYASSLLRFAASGLTWSEGLGTPVFARGYDRPRALTFDPRTSRLWLAGSDSGYEDGLTSIVLGTDSAGAADRPRALASRIGILPAAKTIVGLAPIGNEAEGDFIALDDAGNLSMAGAGRAGLTLQDRLPFEGGAALSLDAGLGGKMFVTARSADGNGQSFSIFRLERRIER